MMLTKSSLAFGFFTVLSLAWLGEACFPKPRHNLTSMYGVAYLSGSYNGSAISGYVKFQQTNSTLNITVNISGLPLQLSPAYHGIHIHQYGILTPSTDPAVACGSTGSHFNPFNQTHGDISSKIRHVGDYGNVYADASGNIVTSFNDSLSRLTGWTGILGRAVVLHQLKDDLGLGNSSASLLTGNSGSRIACGNILVMNDPA